MLNPETITVLDPACGSGHILVEAYDVLKAIYLERGYRMRDIPRQILEKNLYGLDIDDRAAQLAGFALLMKARADDRRLLDNPPKLNVLALHESKGLDAEALTQVIVGWVSLERSGGRNPTKGVDFDSQMLGYVALTQPTIAALIDTFAHAHTFGSLIQIPPDLNAQLPAMDAGLQLAIQSGDLLAQAAALNLLPLVRQARILGMQFDAVVANPPYMGNKYLTPLLKSYLKANYKGFEKDLFSAFMIRDLSLTKESGQLGFMSPFVWMFISSYEELRTHFIDSATLTSLIQLEYSGFDGATVPICTFTLGKAHVPNYTGNYIKLSDFKGHENQAPKTLEAIKNPNCGWFYNAKPDDFKKIPGNPVAYWASAKVREVFATAKRIGDFAEARQGMATSDNNRFLRYWHEVAIGRIGFQLADRDEALKSGKKWFPYNKGGEFRKWYGNQDYVVNWEKDGAELMAYAANLYGSPTRTIKSISHYFLSSVGWSFVSSSYFGVRYYPMGFLFDVGGSSVFPKEERLRYETTAFLCSRIAPRLMAILNPTLNFQVGNIEQLPFIEVGAAPIAIQCIEIAKDDWDNYETSWNFSANPLITPVGYASPTITGDTRHSEKVRNAYPTLEPTRDGVCNPVPNVLPSPLYLNQPINPADGVTYPVRLDESPVGYASRTITSDQCQPEKVRDAYPTLEASYRQWQTQNCAAIIEMKHLEEENNRLFIEAYGLQDELSPEVPEEQITLVRADRAKDCQRLISYAIGCMMGRYRLDRPGLIYAHAGNVDFDTIYYGTDTPPFEKGGAGGIYSPAPDESQQHPPPNPPFAKGGTLLADGDASGFSKATFPPDADGIVPITDELWFEDDAAIRIREFLLAVWNVETLDENMAWLAESLGQKGNETPIETIRRYLAGSFFKDHLQTYKKRPIYWLFSSGKQGAFQALVYLHRYHESTLARMRAEYVVPLTGKIQSRIEMLEKDAAVAASNATRSKLNKDIEKLKKKHVELLAYDEKLRHYADLRIQLDLDDGVKVNYGKFGDLSAEVKAVTGGKDE